ncbi:MAG TPA: 5'-nucleotidase C-terminal domain-containing protein [Symbiobacteriaceae bacterium]
MRRFRFLAALVAAVLTMALLPPPALAQEAPVVEVTIIHDTHMHGNFEADGKNIAQKATIINEIRSRRPSAVFVGVGDDLATSLLSSEFQGAQSIDAFNRMGLAVNGIGNHDFDLGPENLLTQVQKANFPFVNANLKDIRTGEVFGAEAGIREYVILDVNGVKVGFTSLAPEDTAEISSPGPYVQILDYAEAMNNVLPKMRADGAQVTVLLSHICAPDAEALAAEVEGIDVIVGDHCANADLEQPKVIGSTIISRVGDEYDYVGELTLKVQDGKIVGHEFTRHEITAETPEDPEIRALMDEYQRQLDERLGEVIGETLVPLDSIKAHNRFRETELGNFISDVTRDVMGADIAITNGGNIRADKIFQPGPLTKKDVIDILPFTNYILLVEVTGAQIEAALEHGVSTVEEGHGRFPQVSGLSFKLDPTRPPGDRVSDILVNGEPLDPEKIYKLAANDFLVGGGDGYEMFKDARRLVDVEAAPLVSTAVIEAIQKAGTIAPRTEGRILYVKGVSLEVGKPALIIATRTQEIDVAPERKDGQIYLPLRWVAELYGARVEWDNDTRTASATMPWGSSVSVKIGQDGYIVNNRTLVPAPVLEQLGIQVTVEGNTAHLSL